jgi:hypothetical protein
VIAINDAYRLAPWADVLYACDAAWWRWHKGVRSFAGPKYALRGTHSEAHPADVTVLENTGESGLERASTGLRHGRNSGYQAIGVAVHLGAARIVLLGYDMQAIKGSPSHWFGEHPSGARPPVGTFLPFFPSLVAPLQKLGVTVINASRETALTCFPRRSLVEALA